jgi:hypothetical protein
MSSLLGALGNIGNLLGGSGGLGGYGQNINPVNIGAITQFANQQGRTALTNRYAQFGIPNSTGLSYDIAGLDLGTAAEYANLAMAQNDQILRANAQQDQLAAQLAAAQQQLAGLQGGNQGANAGAPAGGNQGGTNPFVVGGPPASTTTPGQYSV